ncbi:MAG: hypothetical protein K0S12_1539 [Bacteroidetes bacterium]|jgi:hypothetical protein|nr:hypothetical protein [Bacteroidota bacterium]
MGLFNFLRKNKIDVANKSKEESMHDPADDFSKQLMAEAQQCVEQFGARFKGLDYSVESLKVVDAILDEAAGFQNNMEEAQVRGVIQRTGSYIFEVARKNYGGKYYWYEKMEQPILVTGQPQFEISLLAFEKVKGRLEKGSEDNIPFFFEGYAERVRNAKKGDVAMII